MTGPKPARRAKRRKAAASKLPSSGSEETYTNKVYGSNKGRKNNNCYAWAIGHYRNSGGVKLQPGDLAKLSGNLSLKSCKDLKKRALADSKAPGQKAMYVVKANAPCGKGYYKVMAFLDKQTDYHWYRQHKDIMYHVKAGNSLTSIANKMGVPPKKVLASNKRLNPDDVVYVKNADVWSHKQGFATGPLLEDACGKIIADPRKACRDYGPYNYKTFCGAYCVQAKHFENTLNNKRPAAANNNKRAANNNKRAVAAANNKANNKANNNTVKR